MDNMLEKKYFYYKKEKIYGLNLQKTTEIYPNYWAHYLYFCCSEMVHQIKK